MDARDLEASGHYTAVFGVETRERVSDALARECVKVLAARAVDGRRRTPLLIFSGASGVAFATAVQSALWRNHGVECGMACVRKKGDRGIGGRGESGSVSTNFHPEDVADGTFEPFFVDDLIDEGRTFRWCREEGSWGQFPAELGHRLPWHILVADRVLGGAACAREALGPKNVGTVVQAYMGETRNGPRVSQPPEAGEDEAPRGVGTSTASDLWKLPPASFDLYVEARAKVAEAVRRALAEGPLEASSPTYDFDPTEAWGDLAAKVSEEGT